MMFSFIKKLLKKKESPVNSIGKTESIVTPIKETIAPVQKEVQKAQTIKKSTQVKKVSQFEKTVDNSAKKPATGKKPGRPKGQAIKPSQNSGKPNTDKK